jgi:predicted alpha/beta hydrolase family esterase
LKRAIILHGTGGSPESNWFRWLEAELKRRGYEIWLPALPHPEHPSLRENVDYVREHLPFPIDDQTLLIGHSSGAILALIIAQELAEPAFGIVAVSVFRNAPSKATDWKANSRLFDVEFDFEAIKTHAGKLLFVHSDNDPYVPLEQARSVADGCQAELVVMSGQGHFNLEQSEAYREFPKLVELLEERHFL